MSTASSQQSLLATATAFSQPAPSDLANLLREYAAAARMSGDFSEDNTSFIFETGGRFGLPWDVEMRVLQEGECEVFTIDCHLPGDCYCEDAWWEVICLGELLCIPTRRAPPGLLPRSAKYRMDFEDRMHPEGFRHIVLATRIELPRGRLNLGMVRWIAGHSMAKCEVAVVYLELLTSLQEAIDKAKLEKSISHEGSSTVQ